jgi:hypothetical protein
LQALLRISVIWMLAVLPSIIIITVQSILGKYGDDSEVAWGWCMAQIAPTGALLSTSVFGKPSQRWKSAIASVFHYRVAVTASLAQGFAMLAVLLVEPLIDLEIIELFGRSSVPLSLLQGLVIGAMTFVVYEGR